MFTTNLKKQTSIAGKQYQELEKAHGLNITQLNKNRENSDLLYKTFDFNKFSNTNEEFNDVSYETKYKHLQKLLKK